MTYFSKVAIVSWFDIVFSPWSVVCCARGNPATDHGLRTNDDFRSNAAVGVDFEQERMSQPAIHDVRLLDAGAEAVAACLDLGDHAFVDYLLLDQLLAAWHVQARDQRIGVTPVGKNAWRIGEQDELLCIQLGGDGGGGGVGVDVEPTACLVDSKRRNQRDDARGAEIAQQIGIDARYLADAAK